MEKNKGIIFNIQRFTLHDGPGIRTEVFLKGCPLKCRWCSNPEGQCPKREMGTYPVKCIGTGACGACIKSCPIKDCITFNTDKILSGIDRDKCISCGRCAMICPGGAIRVWGDKMTPAEVMDEVRRDTAFYERSGGGVTLSGGEPLMQQEFCHEVLSLCRAEGIGTCMETTLFAPWEVIEGLLPLCDSLISDIKAMDDEKHRAHTGVSNALILENLKRVSRSGIPLTLRIPLIPGVNDDDENMELTADLIINEMGGRIERLQLLEFMHLGGEKCASLGRSYPMEGFKVDRDAFHLRSKELQRYFKSRGISCVLGNGK